MLKKFLLTLLLICFAQTAGAEGVEDECPNDPHKTAPGLCGCGFADVDMDQDGIVDCIDPVTRRILRPSTRPLPAVVKEKDYSLKIFFEEYDRVRYGGKNITGIPGRRSYYYIVTVEIKDTYHKPEDIYSSSVKKITKKRGRKRNYFVINNLSAKKYIISYRVVLTKGQKVIARTKESKKVVLEYQYEED